MSNISRIIAEIQKHLAGQHDQLRHAGISSDKTSYPSGVVNRGKITQKPVTKESIQEVLDDPNWKYSDNLWEAAAAYPAFMAGSDDDDIFAENFKKTAAKYGLYVFTPEGSGDNGFMVADMRKLKSAYETAGRDSARLREDMLTGKFDVKGSMSGIHTFKARDFTSEGKALAECLADIGVSSTVVSGKNNVAPNFDDELYIVRPDRPMDDWRTFKNLDKTVADHEAFMRRVFNIYDVMDKNPIQRVSDRLKYKSLTSEHLERKPSEVNGPNRPARLKRVKATGPLSPTEILGG